MDASGRRCFLEVYTNETDEPRLLQLEPYVKFHNVLERFDEDGDLYWQGRLLDPEATPVSVGMPCGVDYANTLRFVPLTSSDEQPSALWTSEKAPLVELTAAVSGGSPHQGRASSLPAHYDTTASTPPCEPRPAAATPVIGVPWYSRPRLLSPAQPVVAAAGLAGRRAAPQEDMLHQPSPLKAAPDSPNSATPRTSGVPRGVPAAVSAAMTPSAAQLHYQQQRSPRPPPPGPSMEGGAALYAPPAPSCAPAPHWPDAHLQPLSAAQMRGPVTRRNRPIRIDPAVLLDDVEDPVELLQSELRQLQREVRGLKQQQKQQRQEGEEEAEDLQGTVRSWNAPTATRRQLAARPARQPMADSPSPIVATSTDASVEELAMELHDRQMHRLYEQRRFYLTGGQAAS